MKRPHSLSIYDDVRAVLDTVIASGQEGRLTFPAPNRATIWCQRANKFRVAMRQQDELVHGLSPGQGSSPYDQLVFRKNAEVVTIAFRGVEGRLEIGGQEVDPTPADFAEFQIPDDE